MNWIEHMTEVKVVSIAILGVTTSIILKETHQIGSLVTLGLTAVFVGLGIYKRYLEIKKLKEK